MLTVAESLQAVLSRAVPLEGVELPLAGTRGQVLRQDVCADQDFPPFDASAMDGYALRRTDAGQTLRVVGTAAAGNGFSSRVGAGECVRIFTGAPVPPGADLVCKQEDAVREGDTVKVPPGGGADYIRRRGENRRAGDLLVRAGTRLGPTELAALASAGVAEPVVGPAPRCAHLVTGSELVAPDEVPAGAQIRDSNSILIAGLLAGQGADLIFQSRVRDDLAMARKLAEALPPHELLLISGGAGQGDPDLARPLLEALGYTVHFEAVNLRPGKPLVFASRGDRLAFALPGNPVSHWVTFHLFVAPLLRTWQGASAQPEPVLGRYAPAAFRPAADPRPTYWPSRTAVVAGVPELTPLPLASSGDSSGLVGANALLPPTALPGGLTAGQMVEFIPCP